MDYIRQIYNGICLEKVIEQMKEVKRSVWTNVRFICLTYIRVVLKDSGILSMYNFRNRIILISTSDVRRTTFRLTVRRDESFDYSFDESFIERLQWKN